MSYPYWQAFKRRVKSADWRAILIAVVALALLTGAAMWLGGDPVTEQELLP